MLAELSVNTGLRSYGRLRIKKTAKEQLVNLVAHKWQPQMAPAIY